MAEKKINGRTFKVAPMLAMDALVLQARLFKLLGPALSQFGAVMQGRGKDATEDAKAAALTAGATALVSIFQNAEPRDVAQLIKDVVELAQIRRESGVYDQCDLDGDFTGDQKTMMQVTFFVLKEQFGDFFSGLPGLGNPGKGTEAA